MKHKAVEENQLYIVDGNGDQHKVHNNFQFFAFKIKRFLY